MKPCPRLLVGLVGLSIVIARRASGQSGVMVQTARRDTLAAEPGSTVTVAFDVRNGTSGAVLAQPQVVVPKGWSVVIGATPFGIAPQSHDVWLVGVSPAPTTTAGTYAVHATVFIGEERASADSVLIRVPERRGLDVYPGEAPPFVMSGDDYPVRFFVHNRGNVAATFALHATTSTGSLLKIDRQSVTVQPGATMIVAGRATSGPPEWSTRECAVELAAVDRSDSTIASSASVRTTIVPRSRGWFDQLSTVPADLMLRSVGRNSGVSPAALSGGGPLSPGSNTQLDFLFRAPVDGPPLFGERDEYRASLTSDNYRVRLGDNVFGFSQLTSSWTPGFGAELSGERAGVTAGAYMSENRWNHSGTERALEVGTSARSFVSASIIGVDRTGATAPGARTGSFAAQAHLGGRSLLEVEGALSDSAGVTGEAHRARLAGDLSTLSYDLSFVHGAPEYAGRDHGQTTAHAGMSAKLGTLTTLSGNASTFSFIPTQGLGWSNSVQSRNVEGSFFLDRLVLGYEEMTRRDSGTFGSLVGSQRGLRLRGTIPVGPIDLSTNVAEGMAHSPEPRGHHYESIAVSLHARIGDAGSVELFGQRTAGMVFETPGSSGGASAVLQLPRSTNLMLSAYGDVALGQASLYFAQVDAELSHRLANGMTLVLRDRLAHYAWHTGDPRSNLVFLELRAPLRIPTGFTRPTGRARGRILDNETGLGVGGALVRLGSEAAVSDSHGRVTFASLAPGRYQASVDALGSRAPDALLTGDVAVEMPHASRQPVDFSLSLVHGGQVSVSARQLDFATTLAGTGADSLVDAGGFANAMIALIGARDTIYQITNQDGVANFRDIPAGSWAVKMIADPLPAAHTVDTDERVITVRAGARATVEFRIVPKRRAVQMMDPPPPVIARPAPAPSP